MHMCNLHYQLFIIFVMITFPVMIECESFPQIHGFTDEEYESDFMGHNSDNMKMEEVKNYVHTYLYTRNERPIVIKSTKEKTLEMQHFVNEFNSMRPTKIVIHGWRSSLNQTSINGVISAYMDTTDYNVIGIDWKPIASRIYTSTISYLSEVGKYVGELINFLVQDLHTSPSLIHIVGHSLGAHVAGIAGSHVLGHKLGRITGLDPAFPGFKNKNPAECLDRNDAQFVDVIHTAAGVIGISESIGHVDFYPNSGRAVQPGCSIIIIKDLICSHRRAVLFFIESIYNSNNTFMAHKCDSWKSFKDLLCHNTETVQMGEYTDMNAKGTFYLITKSKSPYSVS